MKTKIIFLSTLLFIAFFSCKENTENEMPIEEEIDEKYFWAFSSYPADSNILYDTLSNKIFVFESYEGGKIISYDYNLLEVAAEEPRNTRLYDHAMALGYFEGNLEIYVSNNKKIDIYDANTLSLIKSIGANATENTYIGSIDFQAPNLLFVGLGNGGIFSDGIRVVDRSSSLLLASDTTYNSSTKVKTKANSDNTISVFSVGLGGSSSNFDLGIFDKEENTFEEIVSHVTPNDVGAKLIAANNNADYFLPGEKGSIYSTEDLTLIDKLPYASGGYKSIFITKDGDEIVTVKQKVVEIFESSGFDKIREIDLREATGAFVRTPNLAFIDEGKLIVVYIDTFGATVDVHISKIEL